ncbi:MAG TPA: ATP-dependent helicase HrpB [Rhodanobacteraceae bacterium]
MASTNFPISPLLPRICASLAAHPRLVLEAPPGAGKTTQVPPALLGEAWLARRQIVLLEPRRIAARAAAAFMAAQRNEAVGETIGYRIRFESRASDATRILVVTEGILTRMLQDDPELPRVGAIIFDEFHERHLAGDLGAALALDVQASLRPDLRLVVMSATLDDPRLAGDGVRGLGSSQEAVPGGEAPQVAIPGERAPWFDAPVLRSAGRAFPVRVEYPAARRDEPLVPQVRRATERALADTTGDVLVFLPGRREIAEVRRALEQAASAFPRSVGKVLSEPMGERSTPFSPHPNPPPQAGEGATARAQRIEERTERDAVLDLSYPGALPQAGERSVSRIEILPLHGELPLADQQAALALPERGVRRVILATNVAESSITVPGVRAVIDTGLAREPHFDPNSGFTRLATVTISQASADQRAGRAGRVAPGVAYRLWPESQRLEPARTPEIAQTELSGLALELAAWGLGADVSALHWLDAPPAGALAQARDVLQRLGALDADLHATQLGREMLRLGTSPRLAAAALRTPAPLRPLVADLLALLESRSPLRGSFNDDLRARVQALHLWRDAVAVHGQKAPWRDGSARAAHAADASALAAIEQVARGWRKRLGVRHGATGTPDALSIGHLLLHAFPDRAAKQDAKDPRRYVLANGRGARLHEASALFGEPWLVIAEARFDTRDSLILAGAPFDASLLAREFPQRVVDVRTAQVNASGTVEASIERRFDAIVLEHRAVPPTAADTLPALLARVRARGLSVLPWSDAATRLRTRVAWLRSAMPEAALPDVTDAGLLATLETWLAPALGDKRKLAALTPGALSDAFAALLDWPQRKLLETAAPDAITVPSGRSHKLDYASAGAGAAWPASMIPKDDRETDARVVHAADSDPSAALENQTAPTSPVLAVKLQEMFGLAETPRIANGRVPLTLHLLSPAGRPIQVTQDLAGFWNHTYAEVKKELKGRYPKHPWPDDPWNATPTHRAKPRR